MLGKISFIATALMVAATAFAADLPSRKAPPAVPVVEPAASWAGYYAGLEGGYSWNEIDRIRNFDGYANSYSNVNGALGGAHAGYNWQFDKIILGLEGNADLNGATGSATVVGGALERSKLTWEASLRLRAGYLIAPSLLVYATGGWGIANETQSSIFNGIVAALPAGGRVAAAQANLNRYDSFSGIVNGYTVGGGVEYAFAPKWTARVEYRYTDYSRLNRAAPTNNLAGYYVRDDESAVRLGASYRF